MNVNGEKLGI